ncbi:8884_t:CDS:1, partial [Racocetra fulgida]
SVLPFEACTQTTQHLAKEPEVSNNVSRFTIIRENEDFNTSFYNQSYCHKEHYSANSNVHSLSLSETFSALISYSSQFDNANTNS